MVRECPQVLSHKSQHVLQTVRLGGCEIELSTGELRRNGKTIRLGPRTTQLLQVLLDANGELVTRETIHREVWQKTIVEHNTVQAHVSTLRRALGDDRGLLKTYSGRGYVLKVTSQARVVLPFSEKGPPHSLSMPAVPGNIPAATAPLIGRERLLGALNPVVAENRLVTLTGAGGIGKTRLAFDAARLAAGQFPRGLFAVDLATITDPGFVVTALLSSIGTAAGFRRSLTDGARSLGNEPVLIVLDNCEHLIDAVAAACDSMLAANPAIHILATSREPIRASGEVVFKVPPLEVPPREDLTREELRDFSSIQLFLGRSPALHTQFLAQPGVASAVARICRSLDGIPLAIELAAARADSLGIETLAVRLHDSLDLVRGGARTALPRHQTLRATLEWSYGLLAPPQRTLFARLAIFLGGFTVNAAGVVVSDDDSNEPSILGHIADLVDKSLLTIESSSSATRYRFLETTRALAREKLSALGEFDRLSRRHARFRLETLSGRTSPSDPQSFRANVASFRAELENVRACLDWAYSASGDVALGFALSAKAVPLMLDAVMIRESMLCAARALELTPEESIGDPIQDLQIRGARTAASVYITGATERAKRDWLDILERARRLQNGDFEIRGHWGLWTVSLFAGLPKAALAFAEEFTELATRQGNKNCMVLGDRIRGVSLHYIGDQQAAGKHLERMIGRYVHTAQPIVGAGVMNHATVARATLARVRWLEGFREHAHELVRKSVAEASVQDHPTTICFVLVECALPLSLLDNDVAAAREYVALLFSTFKRQAFVVFEIVARCYAALLSEMAGLDDVARLRSSLEELRAMSFNMYSTELCIHLARALGGVGCIDDGAALVDATIANCRETGEQLWKSELTRTRVELAMLRDAPEALDGAEGDLRWALGEARDQGALSLELRVATTLVRLLAQLGRAAEAIPTLRNVYDRLPEGRMTLDAKAAKRLLRSNRATRHSGANAGATRNPVVFESRRTNHTTGGNDRDESRD